MFTYISHTQYHPPSPSPNPRAPTRAEALRGLSTALKEYQIAGLPNNLEFLQRCVDHPAFQVSPFMSVGLSDRWVIYWAGWARLRWRERGRAASNDIDEE